MNPSKKWFWYSLYLFLGTSIVIILLDYQCRSQVTYQFQYYFWGYLFGEGIKLFNTPMVSSHSSFGKHYFDPYQKYFLIGMESIILLQISYGFHWIPQQFPVYNTSICYALQFSYFLYGIFFGYILQELNFLSRGE